MLYQYNKYITEITGPLPINPRSMNVSNKGDKIITWTWYANIKRYAFSFFSVKYHIIIISLTILCQRLKNIL